MGLDGGDPKVEGGQVVVDASVVVKWFVDEEYSREARLLRGAYVDGLIELNAPDLLPYEVLNALKYSGAFGEEELKEVAEVLEDYQFSLYGLKGKLAALAVEVSMRKGMTVYDGSYVALAEMLNSTLYTADERLILKVRDPKVVKHVKEFSI